VARAEPTGNRKTRSHVITVSDRCARGETPDGSGPAVETALRRAGYDVTGRTVVPDERDQVAEAICRACGEAALVITTGGTGLAPRDVTPEATRDVLDVEVPGLAELMRAESLKVTPHAALSRATAGLVGSSLVVNLPGSVKAARENLAFVLPVLPHALDVAAGRVADCGRKIAMREKRP